MELDHVNDLRGLRFDVYFAVFAVASISVAGVRLDLGWLVRLTPAAALVAADHLGRWTLTGSGCRGFR